MHLSAYGSRYFSGRLVLPALSAGCLPVLSSHLTENAVYRVGGVFCIVIVATLTCAQVDLYRRSVGSWNAKSPR